MEAQAQNWRMLFPGTFPPSRGYLAMTYDGATNGRNRGARRRRWRSEDQVHPPNLHHPVSALATSEKIALPRLTSSTVF